MIPCNQCILYVICANKEEPILKCSVLYKHYTSHALKKVDPDLLFKYAHLFGHTDWTVMCTRGEIWLWTPADESSKEPNVSLLKNIQPGRDY